MQPGFELARYLAQKKLPPYITTTRLVRNVSAQPEIAKYLSTYSDPLKAILKDGLAPTKYKPAKNGYFEILPNPELESFPAVVPFENSFHGNTFIIADSSNASATFQFLEFAKDHKLGTIVGQETGGNRQGINGGNYYFLKLPNSRVEIDLPVYFQAPRKPMKDAGIVPDKIISTSTVDIAAGIDTEINYIFTLLKAKNR